MSIPPEPILDPGNGAVAKRVALILSMAMRGSG